MIQEHRSALRANLQALSKPERVLFAFLCCERMTVCCWAFMHHHQYDLSMFRQTLDEIGALLKHEMMPDTCESRIASIEALMPLSPSFETTLAAQARYGLEALMNTLRLCMTGEIEHALDAATNVIDAIDNFEFFAWESEPGNVPFVANDSNWLLAEEVAYQLKLSRGMGKVGDSVVTRYRVENRLHYLPAAVA